MSMISEFAAADNAKRLEKMILDGLYGSDFDDNRSAIRGFIRKHLVQLYYSECDDSYSLYPNEDILKQFPRT
jgi:hypothetical protein